MEEGYPDFYKVLCPVCAPFVDAVHLPKSRGFGGEIGIVIPNIPLEL